MFIIFCYSRFWFCADKLLHFSSAHTLRLVIVGGLICMGT